MKSEPIRVAHPPPEPLVLFDGDCGFCRFWVERWRALLREEVRFTSYQEVGGRFPEVPPAVCAEAMQLIDRDGCVYAGSEAVFRLLRSTPWGWLGRLAGARPLFARVASGAYRFVAHHRMFFSRLTRLGWGSDPALPTFLVARRVFALGLGLVFVAAFGSWLWQWRGLIGARGIAPLEWMDAVRAQMGAEVWWRAPTLFWLDHRDGVLLGAAWLGLAAGALMAVGVAPGACALVGWALYLSFCTVSSPFLDFQWDTLLLETALLATLFLPWRVRPRWGQTTRLTTLGRWLLWFLLARLMLESGVAKLSSGDPNWRNLTAMAYHYETQPLPLWTAWFAHQLPLWLHRLEALATFAIEFLAPVLLFGPRRLRHAAAWAMVGLQGAIALTGNYAFFNGLTLLLALLLFEDRHWPRWMPRSAVLKHEARVGWGQRIVSWLGMASAAVTGLLLLRMLGVPVRVEGVPAVTQPFRSLNTYGLFATMTTSRPEIVVEGSNDGENWQTYEFRWKPGELDRRPRWVAPHQPRLDWQMWFAALSNANRERWFVVFLQRLLEGEPDVLRLLEWNPFPGTPPHLVRARLYVYHYARWGEAGWWKRELIGEYCPALSLRAPKAP